MAACQPANAHCNCNMWYFITIIPPPPLRFARILSHPMLLLFLSDFTAVDTSTSVNGICISAGGLCYISPSCSTLNTSMKCFVTILACSLSFVARPFSPSTINFFFSLVACTAILLCTCMWSHPCCFRYLQLGFLFYLFLLLPVICEFPSVLGFALSVAHHDSCYSCLHLCLVWFSFGFQTVLVLWDFRSSLHFLFLLMVFPAISFYARWCNVVPLMVLPVGQFFHCTRLQSQCWKLYVLQESSGSTSYLSSFLLVSKHLYHVSFIFATTSLWSVLVFIPLYDLEFCSMFRCCVFMRM